MSGSAIRTIVIVGGGSAGWMTAAALATLVGPRVREIVLIESAQIGTIGVGEATLPTLRAFNATLGLDEIDFIRNTQATFKLGIEFRGWNPERTFFHGFGDFGPDLGGVSPHQLWLAMRAAGDDQSYADYSISTVAARLGRFAPPVPDRGSVLGSYSYAFQFDAAAYAAYLRLQRLRGTAHRAGTACGLRRPVGMASVRPRTGRGLRANRGADTVHQLYRTSGGLAVADSAATPHRQWSCLLQRLHR
jgi:hypothetical protein